MECVPGKFTKQDSSEKDICAKQAIQSIQKIVNSVSSNKNSK